MGDKFPARMFDKASRNERRERKEEVDDSITWRQLSTGYKFKLIFPVRDQLCLKTSVCVACPANARDSWIRARVFRSCTFGQIRLTCRLTGYNGNCNCNLLLSSPYYMKWYSFEEYKFPANEEETGVHSFPMVSSKLSESTQPLIYCEKMNHPIPTFTLNIND